MAKQALVFAADPACRDWLEQGLDHDVVLLTADAQNADESVGEINETPDVSVVFVQFDAAAREVERVAAIATALPELPIIAVGREESGDRVLEALRAGARDFFIIGRDDDRLSSLLSKVLARRPATREAAAAPAAREGAHVITLFSSPQCPKLVFAAGHLALVLQQHAPDQRVLLCDLTLPGGNASLMFDTAQDLTAVELLSDAERFDATLVETAFQKLEDGPYILCLPEDFYRDQLGAARPDLQRLTDALARFFDHVVMVIDRGMGIDALADAVEASSRAVMVSDQSVLHCRQNKAVLGELVNRGRSVERLELAVINYRSEIGMDADQIARTLDMPLAGTVGGRDETHVRAMNAGESLLEFASADALIGDVRALASHLTGLKLVGKRSWFQKMLDRRFE